MLWRLLDNLDNLNNLDILDILDILDTFDTDPLVSPKCQSGQAQKSLKIGTIRDITLITSVEPYNSLLKKKYWNHKLCVGANTMTILQLNRDNLEHISLL